MLQPLHLTVAWVSCSSQATVNAFLALAPLIEGSRSMLAPTAALGELHGTVFRPRLDQDPRSLLEAAEQDIMQMEKAAASREPPWDGFCGLLKVG